MRGANSSFDRRNVRKSFRHVKHECTKIIIIFDNAEKLAYEGGESDGLWRKSGLIEITLKARGNALRCCSKTGGAVRVSDRMSALRGVRPAGQSDIGFLAFHVLHGGLGGLCQIRGTEPEVNKQMELPESLSKTKLRKFSTVIREYSKLLGLNDPGTRFSAQQHIIRVCNNRPLIKAAVRPLGGKLNGEQFALFVRYMIDHPIGEFTVNPSLMLPKPPRDNVKLERRVLTKARKSEAAKRELFYDSWDWKKARYQVLTKHGPHCMLCGSGRGDLDLEGKPVRIVVDHIKPLSKFWALRLDPANLQVLCYDCNKGKGAWDETDHRASGS